MTSRLVKCLPHTASVHCIKYSESGLMLTGCFDGVLRVYGNEPLFSLYWSFKASGHIWSVSWSPSNRICASFQTYAHDTNTLSYIVQVWDSSFQTIFKLQQDHLFGRDDVVFASNNVLISSSGRKGNVYWYNMSLTERSVMKVFMQQDMLPFCRDVLKIITHYLPPVTRVTQTKISNVRAYAGAVVSLTSEVVGIVQIVDDTSLLLYKVDGNKPYLLTRLRIPTHGYWLATCTCPCDGEEAGFIIVSAVRLNSVWVSLATSRVWIVNVMYFYSYCKFIIN